MSCNGHNHPPGCQCPFRGGWSGFSSFDPLKRLLSNEPRPRQLGFQHGTAQPLAGGFTRPSAKCPVCGDTVFFYQSPYGGSVFFDDLGPPWPKHPCTDNSRQTGAPRLSEAPKQDGWFSMSSATIERVSEPSKTYCISGNSNGKNCSFRFRADEIVMAEMVRIRPESRGVFQISILDYDTVKDAWCIWQGMCCTSQELAEAAPLLVRATHWPNQKPQLFGHSNQQASGKDDWRTCSLCSTPVKGKNYSKHMKRVHDISG